MGGFFACGRCQIGELAQIKRTLCHEFSKLETLNEYCVWLPFFQNGQLISGFPGNQTQKDRYMRSLPGMSLGREQIRQRGKPNCDGVSREAATVALRAVLKMDDPSELSRDETRELDIYISVSIRNATMTLGTWLFIQLRQFLSCCPLRAGLQATPSSWGKKSFIPSFLWAWGR